MAVQAVRGFTAHRMQSTRQSNPGHLTTQGTTTLCGIAGIYYYNQPERLVTLDQLAPMTRCLRHRGPDGEGFHHDGPLGLGHRRLAIVDLSPTGRQPMANEDGTCWITYNGEFYNHGDCRKRLRDKGHAFRGTSDTETLLHLLEEDGPDCLGGVFGIFAFAFWDSGARRLTLARDPLGVKQLYYHDDGTRLVFASEIKALLACPDVPRQIDEEAVNQYLHFHTPLFERTFFRDIHQLRPGEVVSVGPQGASRRTYWQVEEFGSYPGSAEAAVAELQDLLGAVVRDQLMADVPVGAFFSGGIDSTAVAAFARRHGRPPVCFGVHFTDQGVTDERPFQEAAAQALGLELRLTTLDGATFADDLLRLMYHQDQPVIGPALLPMYAVSRLAADSVKVCLGGQAADEVFGGYARYALTHPWQVIRSWFQGRRPVAAAPAPNGHAARPSRVGGNLVRQLASARNIRRLAKTVSHLGDWETRYFENFAVVGEGSWKAVFSGDFPVSRPSARAVFHETVARSPARDPADKAMHWDVQTYLTGLFQQDDRMSMACGLESRVPLADPRLVRFAFRLGFPLKFRAGASKWALRQAVAEALPVSVLNRRKVGFDTPAEAWMNGRHAGFVRDLLLGPAARQRGLWEPRGLQDLLDHPRRTGWFDVAWKVLCIEAWAQTFLDGPRPESPAPLGAGGIRGQVCAAGSSGPA